MRGFVWHAFQQKCWPGVGNELLLADFECPGGQGGRVVILVMGPEIRSPQVISSRGLLIYQAMGGCRVVFRWLFLLFVLTLVWWGGGVTPK